MSIMTRIRDYLLADPRQQRAMIEQRSAPAMFPSYQLNKPQYPRRAISTYDEQGYQRSALIFRCIQYVASAAGSAPLKQYQTVNAEPVEVPESDLRNLLAQPNMGMGESRFLSFIVLNMNVAGFCVIEKERDRLGNVIALWPLRSDWLRWIPRDDGQVDWEYRNPYSGWAKILLAEDVVPVTYADVPQGIPTGIGPLEVMLREIGIASALTDFLKSFLDRGALPLYAIIPSDDPAIARQFTEKGTREAFQEAWRQRYQGLSNATDPLLLVGAKDIKTIGLNFNELAYPDLNDLTDSRICMGFGVPPILVGTQVGLERSTFSNTAEARKSFYQDTMTYLWSRLDDAFTRHLLPEFETDRSVNLAFDTSDVPALKDDQDKRWQTATMAFRGGGLSVNDYRTSIGLKTVDGGDVFLIPAGVTPVRATDLKALGTEVVAIDATATTTSDTTAEDQVSEEQTGDTQNEGDSADGADAKKSKRAVPPLDDVVITNSDIDEAIAEFDDTFPEWAGLLDAKVEEPE